jgi:signal transduction histidine kinase
MKFTPLSKEVLKNVLIAYFAVTIVVTIVHFGVEFFYQKKLLIEELKIVEKTFKPSLSTALWDMNDNQLANDAKGILSLGFIKAIVIKNSQNELLFKDENGCNNCMSGSLKHSFSLSKDIFDKTVPLGSVTLYSDSASVFEKVKVNFFIILLNALIKSATLIVLFIIVFRKTLNKPLASITKQIENLDLDNIKNSKIEYESREKNELVILRDSVNEMLDRLAFELEGSKAKDNTLYQQNKMASMGEMLGNISHQWKQPLNALAIQTQLLESDLEDAGYTVTKEIENRFKAIDANIKHMSQTIDDFRNFFKPDTKEVSFSLDDGIRRALVILKSYMVKNSIDVVVDVDRRRIVYGYQNQFLHVINNILKNSIDILSSYDGERVIKVEEEMDKSSYKLIFTDSGGGIDETLLESVFERFFTTKDDEGTGLGLHMSKEIIEKSFKGSIEVKNISFEYQQKRLQGASFTITLPATRVTLR